MKNCLVTKLKGVVNNNNLNKFGYIKVDVMQFNELPDENANKIYVKFNSDAVIEVVGDGYIIDSGTQTKSITIPANTAKDVVVSYASNYSILIPKYSLVYFQAAIKSIFKVNIYDFKYSLELSKLFTRSYSGYSVGDIEAFENLPLDELSLATEDWTGKITGDIAKLPSTLVATQISTNMGIYGVLSSIKSINNTDLQFYGTNVSGTIEDFGNAQVSSGRVSGDCLIITNDKVTYKGENLIAGIAHHIRFGSSMVSPSSEETTQGWQFI